MKHAESAWPRPVVFGEVLLDVFPDGRRVLGGAPFNVAWHLQGLGARPLLVTAIGDDAAGTEVLHVMAEWGMDVCGVQVVPDRPTGEVRVWGDARTHRFEIRPDQAYDHLRLEAIPVHGESPDLALLYHGTLALRGHSNRGVLRALVRATRLPVFVDVNLRDPWWSADDVAQWLRGARWLKLDRGELARLAPALAPAPPLEQASRLRGALDLEAVFLTLGAEGAVVATADQTVAAPAPPVSVVDTVGAGDAFSATAILGLLAGWAPEVTLAQAVELASAICDVRGATTADRDLYESLRRRWGV